MAIRSSRPCAWIWSGDYRDGKEYQSEASGHAAEYEARLAEIDRVREILTGRATGDRPEVGADYEEAYPSGAGRDAQVVAATVEGMGVVAPGDTYRPLLLKDKPLWNRLRKEKAPLRSSKKRVSAAARATRRRP